MCLEYNNESLVLILKVYLTFMYCRTKRKKKHNEQHQEKYWVNGTGDVQVTEWKGRGMRYPSLAHERRWFAKC